MWNPELRAKMLLLLRGFLALGERLEKYMTRNPEPRRAEQTCHGCALNGAPSGGGENFASPAQSAHLPFLPAVIFCCNNQLQTNLIKGTRGGKRLSFQVQWSEGLWLTANVFTARRQGPAEEARHLLQERKEWITLGCRGGQIQASRKTEKPAIYTGFKAYIILLLEELKVLWGTWNRTTESHLLCFRFYYKQTLRWI